MTESTRRKPGQVLREARQKDSDRKRSKVFHTVDNMRRDGTPITFRAVVTRVEGSNRWTSRAFRTLLG